MNLTQQVTATWEAITRFSVKKYAMFSIKNSGLNQPYMET
jgi:hypothetical protein